jgi:hypothetical protein
MNQHPHPPQPLEAFLLPWNIWAAASPDTQHTVSTALADLVGRRQRICMFNRTQVWRGGFAVVSFGGGAYSYKRYTMADTASGPWRLFVKKFVGQF